MPSVINPYAINLRNRSIIIFVVYLIVMIIAFVYDFPTYFVSFFTDTKESSSTGNILFIFLSLLGAIALLMNIVLYQHYTTRSFDDSQNILSFNSVFFIQFVKIVVSVLFIAFILWGIGALFHKINNSDIGSKIIDIFLIIGLLAIIYKVLSATGLTKKPIFKILIHSLLYIPCLLADSIEATSNEAKGTNRSILILLFIELVLIGLYIIYPTIAKKIYTQGGKQIINTPIPLNMEQSISTYQDLNETYEHNYQYALSFWFYIDSAPPSMNVNYIKFANILSYGNNPSVKYNPSKNTLSITVSHDEEKTISVVDVTHKLEDKFTNATDDQIPVIKDQINEVVSKVKHLPMITELDEDGRRIIYVNKNVLLQKWNNIILNYNGGTLDIFYNGEIVKSAIEVVPYLKFDTLIVGEQNGISGGIANITYFKEPLDVFKIKNLYNYMKDKNPPSL